LYWECKGFACAKQIWREAKFRAKVLVSVVYKS
jgi:hypothetical protein